MQLVQVTHQYWNHCRTIVNAGQGLRLSIRNAILRHVDVGGLTFSSSASSATFRNRGELGISAFCMLQQSSISVPLKKFLNAALSAGLLTAFFAGCPEPVNDCSKFRALFHV